MSSSITDHQHKVRHQVSLLRNHVYRVMEEDNRLVVQQLAGFNDRGPAERMLVDMMSTGNRCFVGTWTNEGRSIVWGWSGSIHLFDRFMHEGGIV